MNFNVVMFFRCTYVAVSCFFSHSSIAQGVFSMDTDATHPLITQIRILNANVPQPQLEFDFGFSTEEMLAEQEFFDSLTISLQGSDENATAIILTADTSGVVVAPPTPGTIVIGPASVILNAIQYPSLQPVLPGQVAFHVTALLPPEFVGEDISVYFDLFNNLDPQRSQAWFGGLVIVNVPEPGVVPLFLLASALYWSKRRYKYSL